MNTLSLTHRRLITATLAACYAALPAPPAADAAPATASNDAPQPALSAPLSAELRQIQQSLGGSAVEQFPTLSERNAPAASPAAAAPPIAGPHQRHVIESLRMAATQLDDIANRLERFDLYRHADDLREQAQRLRLGERALVSPSTPSPVRPSDWQEIPLPSRSSQDPTAPQPLQPTPAPE